MQELIIVLGQKNIMALHQMKADKHDCSERLQCTLHEYKKGLSRLFAILALTNFHLIKGPAMFQTKTIVASLYI